MLPHLNAEAVRNALDQFDAEFRASDEWKSDGRQRYALSVGGRLYPPKRIVALIIGRTSGFGSVEARRRLAEVGFDSVELAPEQGWSEFVSWVRRIAESSDNIAEEKSYKLPIIANVAAAREAFSQPDSDWVPVLKRAFGPPNNLTPWNMHQRFLQWCEQEPEIARKSLDTLWAVGGDAVSRVSTFVESLPTNLISNRLRVTLASFLLMSEDPDNLPIYRATPFDRSYRVTGFPNPGGDASPSEVYQAALDFLDRLMEECEASGIEIKDRLEAQGAVWSVVYATLSEPAFASWTEEEREALRRFRGEQSYGPYWWVNQGATFRQESTGGYVWAPQRNSAGSQLAHHANVSRLKKGDTIVHYSNGAIRAIGTVLEDAEDGDRPPELPSGPWETDGRLAHVEYRLLEEALPLASIPQEWRVEESNPFDSNGNVRQGYMYPISVPFWEKISSLVGEASPTELWVIGAGGSPSAFDVLLTHVRQTVAAQGREAHWWSYPLQPQHEVALKEHPYLYVYVGEPISKITHRLHILDWASQSGSDGIESPWPEVTLAEDVGRTRRGETQSEIFKTWLLVDAMEALPEPLGIDGFVSANGGSVVASALLNGFGLWTRARSAGSGRSWIFQANPNLYDVKGAVNELTEINWTTRQHASRIHVGDLVYLWESGPSAGIVGTARVASEPGLMPDYVAELRFTHRPDAFEKPEPRVRLSVLATVEPPLLRTELLANPLLSSMSILKGAQGTNFALTEGEAGELARLLDGRLRTVSPPSLEDLAEAVYMTASELAEIESLLDEKRQLILEGPPGSGKTFLARLFARYFSRQPLNREPDERVQVVQFHQSYGYEEFIQGIRPTTVDGVLRYDLQPGVFKKLCATAKANPEKRFALIIDEINRGNISRIFGELLYLLEYRDQAVRLGNSGPDESPFSIPENVYLVGTMNTTDRSLTQIDYALRRRFFFYRLMPTARGTAPVLTSWLRAQGVSDADRQRLVGLFIALNDRIVQELGEHFQIGHSYLMRSGIERTEVLEQVWQRGVLPLLEEYFHNRKNLTEFLDDFRISRLQGNADPID